MKIGITLLAYFVTINSSFSQGKAFYLTGQSDSLFVEMVFFKKSDSIFFYVFDKNKAHVSIPGLKGTVNFVFGKSAIILVRLDSSKYNKVRERIELCIPKDYWENFQTCELLIPINDRMTKFVIVNHLRKEETNKTHQDMPVPGGHSH